MKSRFVLSSHQLHITKALAIAVLATALGACSSTGSDDGSGGSGGGAGGGAPDGIDQVRDDRYCEVLLGTLDGAVVHVDVYNTYLLNDCPEAAWSALDADVLKAEKQVDAVILNGPRRWLMDAFENSKLADGTVVTFGGLDMRLGGRIDVPTSEVAGGSKPYTERVVARATTFVFGKGKPVYELVDAAGRVFDMQSYLIATGDFDESELASLGASLTLPSGWTYRSRILDADLRVTAVDGLATVLQDDRGNTYQLSQQ